jgi:uncharacterized MAPEG superfamily protein
MSDPKMLTPELHALLFITAVTLLMWVPYVLARIVKRGLLGAMANPSPTDAALPAWAERAKNAHLNAVENLAVFAPVVLIAAAIGFSTHATAVAAWTYVAARLVHFVVYTAGIPIVRTLAFAVGFGATLAIVLAIAPHFM